MTDIEARQPWRPLLLLGLLAALLSACEDGDTDEGGGLVVREEPAYVLDVSINAEMVALIDHAAHYIWDAANPDLPVTEIDWQEVEHAALQLLAGRAALTMGGTGVNDAYWVVQPSWREYVNAMNEAAKLARSSARAEDLAGLTRAGDLLVEACESCHQQFKPSSPTEGIMHPH